MVKLTGEIADGWFPMGFAPGMMKTYRPWLEEGIRRAGGDRSLSDLEIEGRAAVVITDDVKAAIDSVKPVRALYVGGMGHEHKNFHKDAMIRRGFGDAAERVQDLYLAGHKEAAAAAIPDEFIDEESLLGPQMRISTRYRAWEDCGITGLTLRTQQPRGHRINGQTRACELGRLAMAHLSSSRGFAGLVAAGADASGAS